MGTFGDKLKRERELRGVTLEEIAEATKIGTRSLKALEEEHFEQLPGGIFNKGFVRAYAKFLGLDEEQAVSDFVTAQGEPSATAKADVMAKMAAQAEASRRNEFAANGGETGGKSGKLWVTFAVLVLLTSGVAAGIRYMKMKRAAIAAAAQPKVVAPPPAPTGVPASGPSTDASLQNGTPAGSTVPDSPPTGASTSATATTPVEAPSTPGAGLSTATGSGGIAGSTLANSTVKPALPTTAPTTAAAKGTLELQIHVSRATWLSVQADGKEATTETLRDSATKTVIAQDRIVITTGNSVDVTCNGKSLGILGADNRRSQLRITSDCKVN